MITLVSLTIYLLFNRLTSIFVKLHSLIFTTIYWLRVWSRMTNRQRLATIPIINGIFLIELLSNTRWLLQSVSGVIDFIHQELNIRDKCWERKWQNTVIGRKITQISHQVMRKQNCDCCYKWILQSWVKLHLSKITFICLWRPIMWTIILLGKATLKQSHFHIFVEGNDVDNNAEKTCK